MGIIEIILIGIGLAMDAFAVSICKGLAMKKMNWNKALIVGLYFGIFQGIMPLIGYLLGSTFADLVKSVDHWVAFFLLGAIGTNMLIESLGKDKENSNDSVDIKTMTILSIATSIDALAIGISFAFLEVNVLFAAFVITIITFVLSVIGVKVGNVFGDKYESKAEFVGGAILILLGIKILLEHLGLLTF